MPAQKHAFCTHSFFLYNLKNSLLGETLIPSQQNMSQEKKKCHNQKLKRFSKYSRKFNP